jgi:hypothetical protein
MPRQAKIALAAKRGGNGPSWRWCHNTQVGIGTHPTTFYGLTNGSRNALSIPTHFDIWNSIERQSRDNDHGYHAGTRQVVVLRSLANQLRAAVMWQRRRR